jgi:hypothetical protein
MCLVQHWHLWAMKLVHSDDNEELLRSPLRPLRFLSLLPLAYAFERTLGWILPHAGRCAGAYGRSAETLTEDMQTVRSTVMLAAPRRFQKGRNTAVLRADATRFNRWIFRATENAGWARRQFIRGRTLVRRCRCHRSPCVAGLDCANKKAGYRSDQPRDAEIPGRTLGCANEQRATLRPHTERQRGLTVPQRSAALSWRYSKSLGPSDPLQRAFQYVCRSAVLRSFGLAVFFQPKTLCRSLRSSMTIPVKLP